MDVFSEVLTAGRETFRRAALHAASALGLFEVLPGDERELQRLLGTSKSLRGLVDVLVAEGVLARDGALLRVAARAEVPPLPREGWGLLAEVLRSGSPIHPPSGELERR